MENLDLQYLCTVIGNLSGVPIRLYDGNTLKFFYSFVKLPKDPVVLYHEDIWNIRESVGYFVTKIFNYYGIINHGSYKIIIGPTRQTGNTDQELRELAFQLDIPPTDTDEFVIGMKSIIRMPLESIMQILCTMNYVLNGEKLSLQDIAVFDDQQDDLSKDAIAKQDVQQYSEESVPLQDVHNTFELEQTVMTMVRKGDTTALRDWIKKRTRCPWRSYCRGAASANEKYLHRVRDTGLPRCHPGRNGGRRCFWFKRCIYSEM